MTNQIQNAADLMTDPGGAALRNAEAHRNAMRKALALMPGVDIPIFTAELAAFGVHGADIASATTTNLETATGVLVDVTGTQAITGITLSEGHVRVVRFTAALTLTHGASLVLPGGANITTVAGDFAVFVGYAAGVVRCVVYSSVTVTGTGSAVRSVSPTLTTANLGTPSALVLTNATGLPAASVNVPALRVLVETHTAASFTDGGGTSGTKAFAGQIPVGAIPLGTKFVPTAGFAGDVSAAATLGDGSDVDRLNTGTVNLFTTAANGVQSGVPSGDKLVTTAFAPVLTVTSATDAGLFIAGGGSVTIGIYYVATI